MPAPSIYENEDIKKGILLQLFGGSKKEFSNTGHSAFRAEVNILLCGDPGTSKSQLLQVRCDCDVLSFIFIHWLLVSSLDLLCGPVMRQFLLLHSTGLSDERPCIHMLMLCDLLYHDYVWHMLIELHAYTCIRDSMGYLLRPHTKGVPAQVGMSTWRVQSISLHCYSVLRCFIHSHISEHLCVLYVCVCGIIVCSPLVAKGAVHVRKGIIRCRSHSIHY